MKKISNLNDKIKDYSLGFTKRELMAMEILASNFHGHTISFLASGNPPEIEFLIRIERNPKYWIIIFLEKKKIEMSGEHFFCSYSGEEKAVFECYRAIREDDQAIASKLSTAIKQIFALYF